MPKTRLSLKETWLKLPLFNPRKNSLNTVRLILALIVLWAHAFVVTGRLDITIVQTGTKAYLYWIADHMGDVAVFSFFIISGYLISASAMSKKFGEYFKHRVARIYPAYAVSAIVIVFIFAPIAFWVANGSIKNYFYTPGDYPLSYLIKYLLFYRDIPYAVAGTPANVPYELVWNGSLWTIYYEVLCYVIIFCLTRIKIFKTSPIPMLAVWVLLMIGMYFRNAIDGITDNITYKIIELLLCFITGSVMFYFRKHIRYSKILGIAALIILLLLVKISPESYMIVPYFAFLLGYFIFTFANYVPEHKWIKNNDISYGVYVYAFPVKQLLVVLGFIGVNYFIFGLVATIITFIFGFASWKLLENPIMQKVRAPKTRIK